MWPSIGYILLKIGYKAQSTRGHPAWTWYAKDNICLPNGCLPHVTRKGSWAAIKVGKNTLVWCFYEMIESLFAIGDTMFLSWLRMIVKFIISRRPLIFVKFASLVLDFIFFLLVLHIFWHLMDLAYPQFPVTFLSSLMFKFFSLLFQLFKI